MNNLNSEKGFLALAFIPLLFALVIGLVGLMGLSLWITYHYRTLNACRNVLIKAQEQSARYIQNLQTLNPKALKLRADEQNARKWLKRAQQTRSPKLVAAASAYLAYILSQRLALSLEQKKILGTAYISMIQSQQKAIQKVRSIQGPRQLIRIKIQSIRSHAFSLAVRPDIPMDIAPAYILQTSFSERQASSVSWMFTTQSQEKVWDHQGFFQRLNRQTLCEVSLKPIRQIGHKIDFQTIVKVDKF